MCVELWLQASVKHYVIMLPCHHFRQKETLKTSCFFSHSIPPLCPPLSLCLSPSVPVPQLRSFHHFYLSLVCCAFSPHRFTSRLPLWPPFFLSLSLPHCRSHPIPDSTSPACSPPFHHAISPWLHPFSPTATPSLIPLVLTHVIMHHAISYRFVTFCFLLGIHNLLYYLSLSFSLCVLCFIFSTWSNYLAFISVSLSVSRVSMPQCVFVPVCAVSKSNMCVYAACWGLIIFHFLFFKGNNFLHIYFLKWISRTHNSWRIPDYKDSPCRISISYYIIVYYFQRLLEGWTAAQSAASALFAHFHSPSISRNIFEIVFATGGP